MYRGTVIDAAQGPDVETWCTNNLLPLSFIALYLTSPSEDLIRVPAHSIVPCDLDCMWPVIWWKYSVGLVTNNNPDNIPIFYPNTEILIKFYGSDLLIVPNDTRPTILIPERSRYLNRFINLPEGQQP